MLGRSALADGLGEFRIVNIILNDSLSGIEKTITPKSSVRPGAKIQRAFKIPRVVKEIMFRRVEITTIFKFLQLSGARIKKIVAFHMRTWATAPRVMPDGKIRHVNAVNARLFKPAVNAHKSFFT
jgi:hypothetical protein